MIKLIDVKKTYKRVVLDNVNLDLKENNIYVIKGISGSGKTTLLNIIAGLDKEYEGSYLLDGVDLKKEKNETIASYMTQNSLLISSLNIRDNLLFIKNDINKINDYASKLNVLDLLNKYPNQLSGGERQRITLIRSLLLDFKIIAADEPTASLDEQSAKEVVKLFEKIKKEDKIIIIATHNDYFDLIADKVFNMDYGIIEANEEREEKTPFKKYKKELNIINSFKYSISKFKTGVNISTIIIMSLMFLVVLVSLGIISNLKQELIKKEVSNNYYHLFEVEDDEGGKYKKLYDDVKIYKNYNIKLDDYTVFGLLNIDDSNLSEDNVIKYGSFPITNKEILLEYKLAVKLFPDIEIKDVVGKEVVIENDKYKVSGILTNNEELIVNTYSSNNYYRFDSGLKAFLPYDEISKKGKLDNNQLNIMSFKDFYKYDEVLGYLQDSYLNSFYYNQIVSVIADVELVVKWIVLGTISLMVIVALFIGNQISLSLNYRKREIGYLQIFGLSKLRIFLIIITQYLITIGVSMLIGSVLYFGVKILLISIMNINLIINIGILLLTILFLFIYTTILVSVPYYKFIKKDILKLIN